MATTKAKIEKLARALFPRYGLHDVGALVATMVAYHGSDGYVIIGRPDGRWSWHAGPGSTVVTPSRVNLAFRSDYRRTAEQARDDLYRQLERAIESCMSEDEAEAIIAAATAPKKKTAKQLDAEIEQAIDRGKI
jgi:hypothetical protein